MRNTNRWILPLMSFSLLLLLGAGCGSVPDAEKADQTADLTTGQKCETDADCGFSVCTIKNIKEPKCVDRSCQVTETKCDEGKHCVQDSSGVKCADAVGTAPPEKPKMSCRLNSNQIKMTGVNAYKKSWFTCGSDCPEGFTCDIKACLCDEDAKVAKEKRCDDEPLFAYASDTAGVQGLKDNYKVFTTDELDGLTDDDKAGYTKRAEKVVVPAYNRGQSYFPFPGEQFSVESASPNHVPCANEYYGGLAGIDIYRGIWFVPGDCGFGPTGTLDGYLLVCPQDLFDWYDSMTALSGFALPL